MALPLHDVAPVARRVADRQEHELVLGTRLREGLLAPGEPVHGVVRVLKEIGRVLEDPPVRVPRPAVGPKVLGARDVTRALRGLRGVEALLQLGGPLDRDRVGRLTGAGGTPHRERERGDNRNEAAKAHDRLIRDGALAYSGRSAASCGSPAVGATELALAVGGRPLLLEPERHDRLVASISHLPFLVASALTAAVAEVGDQDPTVWSVAAGGFRDTSRVAASDTQMFLDILLTNRTAVLAQLERFQADLGALHRLLESSDEAGLRQRLVRTQQIRARWKPRT